MPLGGSVVNGRLGRRPFARGCGLWVSGGAGRGAACAARALIGNVLRDRELRCPADDWGRMPVVCGIGTFWMGNAVLDWRPPVPYRCRGGPVRASAGQKGDSQRPVRCSSPPAAYRRGVAEAPASPGRPGAAEPNRLAQLPLFLRRRGSGAGDEWRARVERVDLRRETLLRLGTAHFERGREQAVGHREVRGKHLEGSNRLCP